MKPSSRPGSEGAQYFARHAEPEAALARALDERYLAALVVPVCGEAPSLLDGFQSALSAAAERVLLILVVNATDAASAAIHAENQRLLSHLQGLYPRPSALTHEAISARAWLARAETHDLLWLDRASPGVRLPPREGVGLARKLGGDLAAALWASGQLKSPLLASSDADVTLPADYFRELTAPEPVSQGSPSAAWLWPYRHEPGGDPAIDAATVLYEISLRYYVLGLASASSQYAYQSVGSTLCVSAPAYLSVRGVPKREAAEDFHLLNKLAKVGPLHRPRVSPIAIRARVSERVPFGTGRRSREIAEELASGEQFLLYSPEIFRALAAVLKGLDDFAESADVAALTRAIELWVPDCAPSVQQVLTGLGAFAALASAATQAPRGAVLRRRIHTWFDSLRTLRFVHGLRDRCFPSVPFRTALAAAPFVSPPLAAGAEPRAICRALELSESALPLRVGPSLL
ncbi:MAG TPA: hypothetical protein VFK05_16155 [Polyangiaceae bacterium]|nr:hypothetical protein [Polyangiaceae bacterium]